jgi:DNA mismatch repair protein MutL
MKIAAGEVIERPASVVKELIENSIDAGSKNIRVEIKNGGLAYLRISDDGCGIPFKEVPLAFERHATSKITEAEDLYNLHTLGFRGEALPSIGAVSQLTMLTRPRNGDALEGEAGSEIAVEGGKLVYHRPAGAPAGTVITVRNLFFNLPARQKWSRSGTSEAAQILTIINNYALAYPEIKFSLVSEGRLLLQTSGSSELKDAVIKIHGPEAGKAMLEVDSHPPQVDSDGVILDDALGGGVRVKGLTAEPGYSKPNRNFITFFVNRRWVISRTLSYAIQEAYHSLLQTGRYPVCVLQIEVDPSEVDANVHPAKTEVRFLHERQVFIAVQKAVRAALVAGADSPLWQAANPLDFVSPAARMVNNIYAPLAPGEAAASSNPGPLAAPSPAGERERQRSWEEPQEHASGGMLDDVRTNLPAPKPGAAPVPANGSNGNSPTELFKPIQPAGPVKPRLPLLRVLGQMANTYLVTEGPDGMYLIDQHAAHERVFYEQFQARLAGRDLDSQLLLEPLLLDLSASQRLWLQDAEKKTELAALGFRVEAGEDHSFWLKAVPATLMGRDIKLSLGEILDEAEGLRDGGCHPNRSEAAEGLQVEVPRSWRDKLAASLACHSAVRAGQVLTNEEMRQLITQLERTHHPNACAHGRPTLMHLSQGQLERGFGRK